MDNVLELLSVETLLLKSEQLQHADAVHKTSKLPLALVGFIEIYIAQYFIVLKEIQSDSMALL